MAEYYAVLSRAVASLEANTPETRRAVYDKARNALIAQLKAIVPPLPTSEISRQRLELEEAIRRAEREATSGAAAAPRQAARRPSPPPPPPQAASPQASPPEPDIPQPQVQPPPRSVPQPPRSAPPPPMAEAAQQPETAESDSPQEVFRRAIREAESRADVAPPPRMERAPFREEVHGDPGANARVADRLRRAPPPPPPSPQPEEPPPYVVPSYQAPRRPEPAPRRPEPEPRLAPDFAWEQEPPKQPPVTPRYAPAPELHDDDQPVRIRDGRRKGSRGRDRDLDADYDEGAMQPSRLPVILLLVLIVALIGGLAALAWWQRGEISKLVASFDGGTAGGSQQVASAPPPPATAAPAADAAAGKNNDRLPGSNAIATTPGVRVVGETGTPAAAPADTTAPAVATAEPQPQPAAPQAGNAALVAQKAVLYEEPLNGAQAAGGVTQINAAVTWDYVADGASGPAVVANLDVPERGLKIRMTIHKNADKTLPASHLIEVVVNTTAAFPGKSISSIPRLVLKPSEDARGQPLIGATAKVQDGLFWIALSALPADVQSNMALLKDRDWIDLPLVYETGQRAILTFEKGTPGDRVLAQAMTAWAG